MPSSGSSMQINAGGFGWHKTQMRQRYRRVPSDNRVRKAPARISMHIHLYGSPVDFRGDIFDTFVEKAEFFDNCPAKSAVQDVVQHQGQVACVFKQKILREIDLLGFSWRCIATEAPFPAKSLSRRTARPTRLSPGRSLPPFSVPGWTARGATDSFFNVLR